MRCTRVLLEPQGKVSRRAPRRYFVGIASTVGCRRFANGAAGAGNWFGLRRFRRWSHDGIPIEQAAAAIAGEKLTFAELIPGLGTQAHPAAGALLVFRTGQARAASGG